MTVAEHTVYSREENIKPTVIKRLLGTNFEKIKLLLLLSLSHKVGLKKVGKACPAT